MRILVIGCRPNPESFLRRLFEGLHDLGHEIAVAVDSPGAVKRVPPPMTPSWLPARARGRRAALHRVAWVLRSGRLPTPSNLGDPTRARASAVHRYSPDVLYFPWNGGAIVNAPLLEIGIPTVLSCRGSQVLVSPRTDRGSGDWHQGLRRTFASVTAVHCVSAHIQAAAESYGLDLTKSTVIPPAVDPQVFRPRPSSRADDAATLRVVTVGSMRWVKGFEYAVVALAHLRRMGRDAKLDVVGDGPERERLLFTAADAGLLDHVAFHQELAPSEVVGVLSGAHVFWLTSLSEGISNAALEAMASGLPVITSDVGGMREAVSDGVNGFVVRARDPLSVAQRTELLARDGALRARLGAAARETVLQRFRLDEQVQAFDKLLRDAASRQLPCG